MATIPTILVAGQSNCAHGSTTVMPTDLTVAQNHQRWLIWESPAGTPVENSGGWVPALASLDKGFTIAIANRVGVRGRTMMWGASGTGLANKWLPSLGLLYPQWLAHWAQAQVDAAPNTLVPEYLVWEQGETDADSNPWANAYGANLALLMTAVRADFGNPTIKVIIPRLSIHNSSTWVPQVRTGQQTYTASDPLSYLLDIDAYALEVDNVHWAPESVIDIGFLVANKILQWGL